jgi:hypothetical protein
MNLIALQMLVGKSLMGDTTERVDTGMLQLIYSLEGHRCRYMPDSR